MNKLKPLYFTLIIVLCVFINSCKKELSRGEVISRQQMIENETHRKSVKVNRIDYDAFKRKVNLNSLGKLSKIFNEGKLSQRFMSIEIGETYKGFSIHLDNIKMISANGMTSYIFPVKVLSKHSPVFQNLTINLKGEQINAFITTYTPTSKWIKAWNSGQFIKFEGQTTITDIDLGTNSSSSQYNYKRQDRVQILDPIAAAEPGCSIIYHYLEVPYKCGSGLHWPNDAQCQLVGEEAAGFATIKIEILNCTSGGGGGGNTTPNPPPDYDPCNPDIIIDLAPVERFTRVAVIPPVGCDDDPPVDPFEGINWRNRDIRVGEGVRLCVGMILNKILQNVNIMNKANDILNDFNSKVCLPLKIPQANVPEAISILNDLTTVYIGETDEYPWYEPKIEGGVTIGYVSQMGGTHPTTGNILLNDKMLNNATNLAVAATMIHELMHSYFAFGMRNTMPGPEQDAFKAINYLLFDQSGAAIPYNDINQSTQHKMLASQYLNSMTDLLVNVAQSLGINSSPDARFSLKEYSSYLFWSSLKDSSGLTPDDPVVAEEIGEKERKNQSDGTGKKGC